MPHIPLSGAAPRGPWWANELDLPGLSVTAAKAFGCQGYFGKVSAGKPACSWARCPVFAKLGQSSPSLSSEAWVKAIALAPSAWWYCFCILSSWLLPGSHLLLGLQPYLLLLVQAPSGCFSTSSLLWGRVLPAPIPPLPTTPEVSPPSWQSEKPQSPRLLSCPLSPVGHILATSSQEAVGRGMSSAFLEAHGPDPRGKIFPCQSLSMWC